MDIKFLQSVIKAFEPDPRYTVTQYADEFRVLSSEASAEVGRYRSSRTPYAIEIMDALSPQSDVKQVKLMKGTQIGGSTIADNMVLTYLDLYPCPILYILPTETLAKGTSKRRISPAIREIKRLASKVRNGKSKNDIGEIFVKEVPGGNLTFGWSNSTASFRSFSARVVILDDIDGYGEFGEGDVIILAKKRVNAFPNSKIYINSTPTLLGVQEEDGEEKYVKGSSLIAAEMEESDYRKYMMPCPHCGERFSWDGGKEFRENFRFDVDENGYRSSDVVAVCPHCGSLVSENNKTKMMLSGKWIPTRAHQHRGYFLPSFYSPYGMLSWNEIADEWLIADKHLRRGDDRKMQVVWNTHFALPWKKIIKEVEIDQDDRLENYGCEVPDGVKVLTAGVDVQDNRVEIVVLGHGANGEIWNIDYKVIYEDLLHETARDALDDYLIYKEFYRMDGMPMKIRGTAIDTGGHRTKQVYEYVDERIGNNIFGIKGSSTKNAPPINKRAHDLSDKNLIILGTNALKDDYYARLGVTEKGENFVHFPAIQAFDSRFFKMLTAEIRNPDGTYTKIRKRNEAIDCSIYAMSVINILSIDVDGMDSDIFYEKREIVRQPLFDNDFNNYLNEY